MAHTIRLRNVLQVQEKELPWWHVWTWKKQDIWNSPSHYTQHWEGFTWGCIQVWALCFNQCVTQLERGQRQAPRQIRCPENMTSEENLQLVSLEKKELRRQHHNNHQVHKSMLCRREAQPTLGTHGGHLTQEAFLPARKNQVRRERQLARTSLTEHCSRLPGEALVPLFLNVFKTRLN